MKRVSSLLFGTRSWPEHYILILQMIVSSPSGPTCFSRWVLHSPATPHFSLVPQQACTSIVHCLCSCGSFCLPGMSFLPRTAWQTLTHRSRPKLNVTFPVMPSSAFSHAYLFNSKLSNQTFRYIICSLCYKDLWRFCFGTKSWRTWSIFNSTDWEHSPTLPLSTVLPPFCQSNQIKFHSS